MPLQIIKQDIPKMKVDAIVNTTNEETVGYSGGDTIGAITGSIAEASYGVDEEMKEPAVSFPGKYRLGIAEEFEEKFLTD